MRFRCLVTGGAGFIGSNIVKRLLENGNSVRVIDNLSTGKRENLASIHSDIDFIEDTICNPDSMRRAARRIDIIFHQAALPSVPRSIENPEASHANNITGTLNVLRAAHAQGVKRVIYAASSSAYGDTPTLPKVETMPPNPLSPYAVTKLAGEYYCQVFSSAYALETISLRYFNVFGPHQNPDSQYAAVVPKFIRSLLSDQSPVIYGDGEQTRDFTYIDNVVTANIMASRAEKTQGEVINIATASRTSVNRLFKLLQNITQTNIQALYQPQRGGDVKHSLADISRAVKLIGYRPVIELETGLKLTVEWMRSSSPKK